MLFSHAGILWWTFSLFFICVLPSVPIDNEDVNEKDIQRISEKELNHVSHLTSDFGIRVFKDTAKHVYGNILLSPLSLSTGLAAMQLGSAGTTRSQLDEIVGFGNTFNDRQVHPILSKLLRNILENYQSNELRMVDILYLSNKYSYSHSFSNTTKFYYDTFLKYVDFSKVANADIVINNFISSVTNFTFLDAIKSKYLTASDVLLLINLISFKMKWYKGFDQESTTKENFTSYLGHTSKVNMMKMKDRYLYGESEEMDCKIIELYFSGDKASMLIFLPRNGYETTQIEQKLDFNTWRSVSSKLESKNVYLSIPKFSMTVETNVAHILPHSGLKNAFSSSLADFPTLSDDASPYISSALHKIRIDISESGVEPSSSIQSKISSISNDPVFLIDRPFIFILRDVRSNAMFVIGRIGDPNKMDNIINSISTTSSSCNCLFNVSYTHAFIIMYTLLGIFYNE